MAETLKGALPRVKLTAEQAAMWETTCTAFLWHCPAFSHVFYNLLDRSGSEYHAVFTTDGRVPIAATDGAAIALNPMTYFKYNLHGRVFIFCHEVMHCILNHVAMGRKWAQLGEVVYQDGLKLPYIHKIMGWAADFVINDTLRDCGHGKMPDDAMWDRGIGTWEEAVVDVYRKIYQKMKSQGRIKEIQMSSDGGMPGSNQKPFDTMLEPGEIDGKDPTVATLDRNEAEWRTTCETANQIARLRGDMPSSLKRLFGEALEPHVPWEEHVETLIARRMGSDGYNWRRPDRRLIIRDCYSPGRSGHGAKLIVVGTDTSGSVGNKELDMWFAELAGVFDSLRPERIIIMWCDAAVHDVSHCDEPSDLNVIREEGVGGGGGTSFVPVFDMIDEMDLSPDALIYLTDGHGTFPDAAPSFPVIWGSIDLAPESYPFGDVVMVPKQIET